MWVKNLIKKIIRTEAKARTTFTRNEREFIRAVTKISSDRLLKSAVNIVIIGGSGSGKTTLASNISSGFKRLVLNVLDDYTIKQYDGDNTIIVDRPLTLKEFLELLRENDIEVVIIEDATAQGSVVNQRLLFQILSNIRKAGVRSIIISHTHKMSSQVFNNVSHIISFSSLPWQFLNRFYVKNESMMIAETTRALREHDYVVLDIRNKTYSINTPISELRAILRGEEIVMREETEARREKSIDDVVAEIRREISRVGSQKERITIIYNKLVCSAYPVGLRHVPELFPEVVKNYENLKKWVQYLRRRGEIPDYKRCPHTTTIELKDYPEHRGKYYKFRYYKCVNCGKTIIR